MITEAFYVLRVIVSRTVDNHINLKFVARSWVANYKEACAKISILLKFNRLTFVFRVFHEIFRRNVVSNYI